MWGEPWVQATLLPAALLSSLAPLQVVALTTPHKLRENPSSKEAIGFIRFNRNHDGKSLLGVDYRLGSLNSTYTRRPELIVSARLQRVKFHTPIPVHLWSSRLIPRRDARHSEQQHTTLLYSLGHIVGSQDVSRGDSLLDLQYTYSRWANQKYRSVQKECILCVDHHTNLQVGPAHKPNAY